MPTRTTSAVLLIIALTTLAAAAAPLPETTPTGILVDRVLPLAHLEDLDGSPGAPPCDLARWRQVVFELRRAAEREPAWPRARALQQAVRGRSRTVDIPLALAHARYDRLDAAGAPVGGEVFALAALRDQVFHGAAVRFVLDSARMLEHGVVRPSRLTLDPDDGGGPRDLRLGRPLAAAYASTGVKHPVLTATWADGRTLTATTTVVVRRLAAPAPHATWPITATEAYDGAAGTGQAYVYLAPGHTAVTNPVVVVEGFDLDDSMDWDVLYDLLNRENLLEDLRADGFDAVVLDFTEATAPIQRNAFVLAELIAQVRAEAPAGNSLAVIGASMGGLVGRYALAWLEQQGVPHDVRTFIAFDTPHLGADIPLGLQHWLEFFQGNSESAAYLLSRLDTPASRQMLLYHHGATVGATAAADPQFAAFQAELAGLGGWPSQPRLVAVANGSGAGADQGFAPGDQLIRYEHRSLLVDIDGNVWAVPDGGGAVIFDGMIDQIWPLPDTFETVTVGGTSAWDGAPGGYRASMAQMDTTAVPYGDIVALHDNHCFVPTVSALALVGAGPFHDVAGDPALMDLTDCDQLYFPSANQAHIEITPENKVWFLDEITAGLSPVIDTPAAASPTLAAAVPNPFNPRTTLSFFLPERAAVSLRVYDLSGRLVRTLADGDVVDAGRHRRTWAGRDDAGRDVAAGIYLYRLEVDGRSTTRRMALVR